MDLGLQHVDNFIIDQFDKAVTCLQDWMYLSQKMIERFILVVYVLVCAANILFLAMAKTSLWMEIFCDVVVFFGMSLEHRMTKTERTTRRYSNWWGRISWIMICLFLVGLNIAAMNTREFAHHNHYMILYDALAPLWGAVRVSMSYVTIVDVDGLRGKAAKLSWEKLKELFGTSWVPQPEKG